MLKHVKFHLKTDHENLVYINCALTGKVARYKQDSIQTPCRPYHLRPMKTQHLWGFAWLSRGGHVSTHRLSPRDSANMALMSSASLSIRGLRDCFFLGGGADEEVPSVAAVA